MKRLTLLIPKKQQGGKPQPPERLQKVLDDMCTSFGGCTVQPAAGYWINAEGKQELDIHTMVFTDMEDESFHLPGVLAYIETVRRNMGQDAIYATVQNIEVLPSPYIPDRDDFPQLEELERSET